MPFAPPRCSRLRRASCPYTKWPPQRAMARPSGTKPPCLSQMRAQRAERHQISWTRNSPASGSQPGDEAHARVANAGVNVCKTSTLGRRHYSLQAPTAPCAPPHVCNASLLHSVRSGAGRSDFATSLPPHTITNTNNSHLQCKIEVPPAIFLAGSPFHRPPGCSQHPPSFDVFGLSGLMNHLFALSVAIARPVPGAALAVVRLPDGPCHTAPTPC